MMTSRALSFSRLRRAVLLAAVSGLGFMAAVPSVQAVSLDVPYVPTPPDVVNRMLELAKVGPEDFVIDLGSGDGRIAIAAVKDHGAKGAMGVDLNPERIAEARSNATTAQVSDKVEFREQDLFHTDFSQASVLTMYLLPDVNVALRPKILQLRPGTRVVSHAFDMGEWEADHYERVDGRSVHLWIVPAALDGRWKFQGPDSSIELDLTQDFQTLAGTAKGADGNTYPVAGKLDGANFELTVGEGSAARIYKGNVQGGSIEASAGAEGATAAQQNWKGSRL